MTERTGADESDFGELSWSEVNRIALRVIADRVFRLLDETPELPEIRRHLEALEADLPFCPHALTLIRRFGLSDLNGDMLALIAGPDLSTELADRISAHPLSRDGRVTPALIAALGIAKSEQVLSTVSPLRRFLLVHLLAGPGYSVQPLSADESVLHAMNGVPAPCQMLSSVLLPAEDAFGVGQRSEERLSQSLRAVLTRPVRPVLHLKEEPVKGLQRAAAALRDLGLNAFCLASDRMSASELDQDQVSRSLERDLGLISGGLLLPIRGGAESAQAAAVWRLAERLETVLIVISDGRPPAQCSKPVVVYEPDDASGGQSDLWQAALAEAPEELLDQVPDIAHHFTFPAAVIGNLAEKALTVPDCDLWQEAKAVASKALSGLAHKIEPRAGWDDLVLPNSQKQLLQQMTGFLHQRRKVLEEWGFAAKSDRGLGLVALFTGDSGGGKTMAAEIIARSMGPKDSRGLDLYRIDLSALVSKYIGETEKNLACLFDAAENSGAILLFDEGDALFSRRGKDVNSSLDRHANQETAYLLQRLESYDGIAILTTNLKEAIDPAFLRRFRFIVNFPFPGLDLRRQIWQSVIPEEMPVADLDWQVLATLDLTGGQIRSVAITAGFLAASEGASAVTMAHLRKAAYQEFDKQNRPLPDLDWGLDP